MKHPKNLIFMVLVAGFLLTTMLFAKSVLSKDSSLQFTELSATTTTRVSIPIINNDTLGADTTSVDSSGFITPIIIDLGKDSLTGLPQQMIISDFYINFATNGSALDSTAQSINLYYYIVTYDLKGRPFASKKDAFIVRQGTPLFHQWLSMFDKSFKQSLLNTIQANKQ